MLPGTDYLKATLHPWPCLLFLMPLLLVYEGGVFWMSGTETQVLRNGADAWLRRGVQEIGFRQVMAAPILLIGFLTLWAFFRRADKPASPVGTCFGMLFESLLYAAVLWGISTRFDRILDGLGIPVANVGTDGLPMERISRIIMFTGAGIYEEVLFRLILMGGLAFVLKLSFFTTVIAKPLALVASSALFALAHHIGPNGETYNEFSFLFRLVAGLFFGLLYWFRGFGIAVGAHAAYDVMVGVKWD